MQDYKININYAKALFLLAGETQEQDSVAKDMRLVSQVCHENRILNVVFNNPNVKTNQKIGIITDIFASHVCQTTMTFLSFVIRKNRTINLKDISNAYLDLYRDSRNIVLSEFTTALPADEETQAIAKQIIADHTQKEVELVAKTDPDIIGGFSIKFDNTMYDARISTSLAKLRRAFEENTYDAKL